MVKIFCYLVIIGIFVSCGSSDITLEVGPVQLGPDIKEIPLNDINDWPIAGFKDGFLPHENHIYGFDYNPNSINNVPKREDSIVYISIPKNGTGYTTVFTDTLSLLGSNYNYYYCNPEDNTYLPGEVDISKDDIKHTYKVTSSSNDIVGLCKESNIGVYREKIQELHIKSYEWQSYDFYVHVFGSGYIQDQLLGKSSFWTNFDNIYEQAIVSSNKGNNSPKNISSAGSKKIKDMPYGDDYLDAKTESRNYILSIARADDRYSASCYNRGDIGNIINTIISYQVSNKRAIIQVNYPTKRFWPLTNIGNNVDVCGFYEYANDPKRYNLELEPLPNAPSYCLTTPRATVTYNIRDGFWYLNYNNGESVIANITNANPECVVFAEKGTYDLGKYVGEIPYDLKAAVSWPQGKAIAILPWQGDITKTQRTALHELGHTMGLYDVNDDLSFSPNIQSNSSHNNLMHYDDKKEGYKLRNRYMRGNGTQKYEKQWDCLHKELDACIDPTYDPYY